MLQHLHSTTRLMSRLSKIDNKDAVSDRLALSLLNLTGQWWLLCRRLETPPGELG